MLYGTKIAVSKVFAFLSLMQVDAKYFIFLIRIYLFTLRYFASPSVNFCRSNGKFE